MRLVDDPVSWFAEHSGVHKKIVKKYFDEIEKAGLDWQNFDIETIADEIKDFSQTGGRLEHPELRRRLGLSPVVEKTAEQEAEEQEIESLLADKEGVKTLLKRIYENPNLSDKQKSFLKEKIIGGAPEIATLIALYDGAEKDYAKMFLKEMVFSPVSDFRELIKGDTLKVKSSRGWVKEINDTPLQKPIRSIDFIPQLKDWYKVASQSDKQSTITVYGKEKPVVVEPVKPQIIAQMSNVEEFVIPESRVATGGSPLATKEFCYYCGRGVLTDQYSKQVNSHTVYFCSLMCYELDKRPHVEIPKYGIGQSVSEDTIAEIRSKAVVKPLIVEKPKPVSTVELVESIETAYNKRADELVTAFGYDEVKKMVKEHNLRVSGSKTDMLKELIKHNIL